MGLQYEGDVLNYGSGDGCCTPGRSRLVVNSLNGLSGPINLVDENGNVYTTDGNTIVIQSSSGGGSGITPLTLAELKAIPSPDVGAFRAVYEAAYGWGVYVFSADATATSAPLFYRADDDTGVWNKVN